MTDKQWNNLLAVIDGEILDPLPVGFIIDSPWLPGWAGMSIKEYFDNPDKWLEANLKAVKQFPDIMFLPGFWGEYGMCTEPSAFGAKCVWHENDLPFAEKVISDIAGALTAYRRKIPVASTCIRASGTPLLKVVPVSTGTAIKRF